MNTNRGKFRHVDAAALDRAMLEADMDAATLARLLAARRGDDCSAQYVRLLRSGQRTRVRAELAQSIEAVLARWSPASAIFTDPVDNDDNAPDLPVSA